MDTKARVWTVMILGGVLGVGLSGLSARSALSAQGPPAPPPITGNPTPGTVQPAPPNLADRMTLIGCVQAVGRGAGEPSTPAVDANTPSDSRFVLTDAKRENRVPPDTGASAPPISATSPTYRLAAIDAALSPFVDTKVEVSGAIEPSTTRSAEGTATMPVLRVEFVKKVARTCS